MHYASARDFFNAVREAAIDAERCRRELDEMEQRTLSVGSPTFEARVSGGEHDRLALNVAAYVDREALLQSRIDDDYDLIDLACVLLYGEDGISDGLATLCPPWWADAVYQRYVACHTWDEVGELVMYAKRHAERGTLAAFDFMDANGMLATIEGRGTAAS